MDTGRIPMGCSATPHFTPTLQIFDPDAGVWNKEDFFVAVVGVYFFVSRKHGLSSVLAVSDSCLSEEANSVSTSYVMSIISCLDILHDPNIAIV